MQPEDSSTSFPSSASRGIHGGLFVGLLGVSGLGLVVPDAINVLGLVVANTVLSNSYVWNLVTAPFFETDPLKFAVDAVVLYYIFTTVNYPSAKKFVSYLAIMTISCTILTSTFCILNYFITADPSTIIAPIHGFGGVLVSILSYSRQHKGQENILGDSPFRITFHNLPVLLVLGEAILFFAGFGKYTRDLPFTVICLYISWSYLRFYQRNESGDIGNQSSSFSFVSMFPERLHIVFIPLFTSFYNLMAIIGLYPKLAEAEKRLPHHLRFDNAGAIAGAPAGPGPSGNTSKRPEDIASERRRAKALKLLDAKMAELSSKEDDNSWGDEEQPVTETDK